MTTKTAYSYVRFSTPRQQHGDSLRRQTAATEAYTAAHGLTLDRTLNLKDLGISAFKGRNAAAGKLGLFLQAVEDGKVEAGATLIVESIDRLSRAEVLTALELFTRIINLGIGIVTLVDGKSYTQSSVNANPMDLMYSIMVMSRANEESSMKSNRSKANWTNARAKAKENGRCTPGHCPFWCRPNPTRTGYEIIPAAMATARRIVDEALNAAGPFKIATGLNADGIISPRGKKWSSHYVALLLKSKTIIGEYQPKDPNHKPIGEAVASFYPSVCSPEEYYRLQAHRQQHGTKRVGRTGHAMANLFGGILFHAATGATMRIANSAKRRILVSSAAYSGQCGWDSFDYATFEEAFLRWIHEVQITPAARTSRAAAIETELGIVAETLTKLQTALNENGNVEAFIIAVKNATERQNALKAEQEAERTATAAPTIDTTDITTMYAQLAKLPASEHETQRAKLRAAVAAVTKRIDFTSQHNGRIAAAVATVELCDGSRRLFGVRKHGQQLVTVTDGKQHAAVTAQQTEAMLAALVAKNYTGAGILELKQGQKPGTMDLAARITRPQDIRGALKDIAAALATAA